MLDNLLLDVQPFTAADGVHVPQGTVFGVGLLAVVRVLLLGGWRPEGIGVDGLRGRERERE